MNEKILENDYNISFIENILFNEIFINNKLNGILNENKKKSIENFNKIVEVLDKNKIEYIKTKYLNSFMINFNIEITDEIKESLLNNNFIFNFEIIKKII